MLYILFKIRAVGASYFLIFPLKLGWSILHISLIFPLKLGQSALYILLNATLK